MNDLDEYKYKQSEDGYKRARVYELRQLWDITLEGKAMEQAMYLPQLQTSKIHKPCDAWAIAHDFQKP